MSRQCRYRETRRHISGKITALHLPPPARNEARDPWIAFTLARPPNAPKRTGGAYKTKLVSRKILPKASVDRLDRCVHNRKIEKDSGGLYSILGAARGLCAHTQSSITFQPRTQLDFSDLFISVTSDTFIAEAITRNCMVISLPSDASVRQI
jgi:hypothetical protein